MKSQPINQGHLLETLQAEVTGPVSWPALPYASLGLTGEDGLSVVLLAVS